MADSDHGAEDPANGGVHDDGDHVAGLAAHLYAGVGPLGDGQHALANLQGHVSRQLGAVSTHPATSGRQHPCCRGLGALQSHRRPDHHVALTVHARSNADLAAELQR